MNAKKHEPEWALSAFEIARKHGAPLLSKALDRWFGADEESCDVRVDTNRGLPLLSVAEGNLRTFEYDENLKSYRQSNHVFADVFGPADIRWPNVLFLSRANPPGIRIETVANRRASLVYLGAPYSLAEITAGFSDILREQGIRLVRPWFLRSLRAHRISPDDLSFRSFVSLPTPIGNFLTKHRRSLIDCHSLFVGQGRLDLEAVAEHLGIEGGIAEICSGIGPSFRLRVRGGSEYEFTSARELKQRRVELSLTTILAAPHSWDVEQWRKLSVDTFEGFNTVLFYGTEEEWRSVGAISRLRIVILPTVGDSDQEPV